MEPRFVYSHPSIDSLITIVTTLAHGQAPAQTSSRESDSEKMQKLYEKYTSGLPVSGRSPVSNQDKLVVLLTGSTGSLGSYILDSLLAESRVKHIYCLNRGSDSLERQQKSQCAKGLQQLADDKVTCLDSSLSKDFFGLPIDVYQTLLRETTHIIHNAWQVDFNIALESFSSHVSGVRRLVDFSAHTQGGAQIFFVSSISAVANAAPVPEKIVDDWRAPQENGYGQSKFVAERVLDAAAKVANVPTVVCRVGQIAGPTTAAGVWPKQEWLPSLIASSRYLGKLPSSLGRMETVDWIPSDILGRGIVDLAIGQSGAGTERAPGTGALVYHAVNPRETSWASLVETVSSALGASGANVETVPLGVWLEALRRTASEEGNITLNPAVKILDFYEGLVAGDRLSMNTEETVRASSTLAGLSPVDKVWMENWMKQWSF